MRNTTTSTEFLTLEPFRNAAAHGHEPYASRRRRGPAASSPAPLTGSPSSVLPLPRLDQVGFGGEVGRGDHYSSSISAAAHASATNQGFPGIGTIKLDTEQAKRSCLIASKKQQEEELTKK